MLEIDCRRVRDSPLLGGYVLLYQIVRYASAANALGSDILRSMTRSRQNFGVTVCKILNRWKPASRPNGSCHSPVILRCRWLLCR